MNLSLYKIQMKVIRRSLWLYILIIGVLSLSLLSYMSMIKSGISSVGLWINLSTYPVLFGMLGFLMLGTYISNDYDEHVIILNIKYFYYILTNILAILTVVFILLIVPIGLMVINCFIFKMLSIELMMNLVSQIFMIWGIAFSICGIFGIFSGSILKNKFSYILGIFFVYISSPLFLKVFSNKYGSPFKTLSLLNLCVYDINGGYDQIRSFVFDTFYIMDKMFSINLAFILILISVIKYNKNKFKINIFKNKLTYVLIVSILVNIYIISKSIKIDLEETKSSTSIIENKIINDDIKITNYNMDINLKKGIENKCTVNIVNVGSDYIKKVYFALYKELNIENVLINNQPINYSFENGVIEIDLNTELNPTEKISIEFNYRGNIKQLNKIGEEKVFTHKKTTFLDESVNWFPKLKTKDDNLIEYIVNVKSNNRCESNLENTLENKSLHGYNYVMSGTSNELIIIQGYIDKISINGIEYIGPEEFINNNKVDYKFIGNLKLGDEYILDKDISKVIFLPYNSIDSNFKIYNNTFYISEFVLWNYVSVNTEVKR